MVTPGTIVTKTCRGFDWRVFELQTKSTVDSLTYRIPRLIFLGEKDKMRNAIRIT